MVLQNQKNGKMLLYMYKQAACALIIIGRFFWGKKVLKLVLKLVLKSVIQIVTQFAIRK